jgi:hypothetical protein
MSLVGCTVQSVEISTLDIVTGEVANERKAQLAHFEALDTKAGIVLGFAGALAALAPVHLNAFVDIGRVVAVISALMAMSAFWPRRFPVANVRELRDNYLKAESGFVQRRLLAAHIEMVEQARTLLARKGKLLQGTIGALAVAASLVGSGTLIG